MFDRIEFIISEAFASLRRNPLMVVAATITVAVSLVLIGGFGYIYFRAAQYAKNLPSDFDMRVYAKDSVQGNSLAQLQQQLAGIPGVAKVDFLPKEAAWTKMKAEYPSIPFDITNPLPNAFNLKFSDLKDADNAATSIATMQGVEKVLYQRDLLKAMRQGLSLLQYIGYLGILLFLISGIVVYNAIKLTIYSRRVEIRIMGLVGASYATIKIPFILEGMIQGAMGGILAGLSLAGINAAFARFTTGMHLTLPTFPIVSIVVLLAVVGIGLGAICSGWAIQAPLRAET